MRPSLPQGELGQLVALLHAGRYAELESRADLLLQRYPDSGITWKILGTALGVQAKNALPALQKAVQFLPNDAEVYYNLGLALQHQGQLDAAVTSYRRALTLKPNDADTHNDLGNALQDLGQHAAAVASYRRALAFNPKVAETHNNLGFALQALGQLEAAQTSYRQALAFDPMYAVAHNNLGNVLQEFGQMSAAVASFRRALEIKQNYAEAHYNLGNALQVLGQLDAALVSYNHALEIKSDFAAACGNRLFALNFIASHASTTCLEEARAYGNIVAKQVKTRFSSWQCSTVPDRLRVGLVSGDLRNHPVGYALENLLAQLDRTRIELIAYPTSAKVDSLTARIQPYFADWKPIYGKSNAEAAQLIHADGIHILLDLSGHTAHNRLPVFAWKPAPVQASWLGYFATTGVAEMDYLLTSEVAVPPAQCTHFTESMWYLPDIWLCFTPPELELPVSALPALTNAYLTFGCFQRMDKISDAVLGAWGRILMGLPQARLRLANKQLGDAVVAQQFKQRLHQHGIDPARVMLQGAADSRQDYLARYTEVDIMLDTFPYPGVTTTCEALWMGVPTLTLAGDTLLSRQGAGVIAPAGLGDWIASSETEYLEKAIQLTSDLPKLAALRAELRVQVLASPVFDAARFARHFEAALWGMWREYRGLEI